MNAIHEGSIRDTTSTAALPIAHSLRPPIRHQGQQPPLSSTTAIATIKSPTTKLALIAQLLQPRRQPSSADNLLNNHRHHHHRMRATSSNFTSGSSRSRPTQKGNTALKNSSKANGCCPTSSSLPTNPSCNSNRSCSQITIIIRLLFTAAKTAIAPRD